MSGDPAHDQSRGGTRSVSRLRRARRLRDRRGRGLRGRLAPPEVPISQTRADQFDEVVREAVAHLDHRWSAELAEVEFVVDEVPPAEPGEDGLVVDGAGEAGEDVGHVRLSRLVPASGSGRSTRPPRIELYRRPLELRALDADDLAELVLDVLIHEVADLLGVGPEVIDPEGHGDADYED